MSENTRRMRFENAAYYSDKTGVDTGPETIVQQHFADEVDINTIVRRFGIGPSTPLGASAGVYGDFTGVSDYESALNTVRRAEQGFMTLPADVRERFDNDPGKLIEFAEGMSMDEFVSALEPAVMAPEAPLAPVEGSGDGK